MIKSTVALSKYLLFWNFVKSIYKLWTLCYSWVSLQYWLRTVADHDGHCEEKCTVLWSTQSHMEENVFTKKVHLRQEVITLRFICWPLPTVFQPVRICDKIDIRFQHNEGYYYIQTNTTMEQTVQIQLNSTHVKVHPRPLDMCQIWQRLWCCLAKISETWSLHVFKYSLDVDCWW